MLFEVSLALAWCLALVEGLMIIAFMWVLGRLRQQYDSKFQPLLTEDGPPLRSFVPRFKAVDLWTDREFDLWEYVDQPMPVVGVFVRQDCAPCGQILQSAELFRRRSFRDTRFLVIVDAAPEEARDYLRGFQGFDAVADEDSSIADVYNVRRWPFGILVRWSGFIANKGVVNTPQHLDGLVMGRGKPIENVWVHTVSTEEGA